MLGKLITLEGIDGSGKSTLLKCLKHHFRENPEIIFTREPTDGWIGEAVHRAISSRVDPMAELFLFIADHADHLGRVIRPALEAGSTVISDRYSDSRYAYQGATLQGIIKDPLEWIIGVHKEWTVVPDLSILLDINPDAAVERVGNRGSGTKFEKVGFLSQVRANYLKLVEMNPNRFIVIDAHQSIDSVRSQVLDVILAYLKL